MRLFLKILSLPFILITWILYGVCKLIVLASGVILGKQDYGEYQQLSIFNRNP